MKLTYSIAPETTAWRHVVDASTLRWKPGCKIPQYIETTMGNGNPFVLADVDADRTAYYKQQFGILKLTVFND